MSATVILERMPDETEVEMVMAWADKECVCTGQMKEGLKVGSGTVTCKPCMARHALNLVVTLYDTL